MPVKSSAKGAAYERHCASELSLWITCDSTSDAVWRSAASGARATRQAAQGDRPVAHVGDLVPALAEAHEFFDQFVVECKRVKLLNWNRLLRGGKACNIESFWMQARAQANSARKEPFLMMREDNGPDLILMDRYTLPFFEGDIESPLLLDIRTHKIDVRCVRWIDLSEGYTFSLFMERFK